MDQQGVRKTYKEKLRPAPHQERQLVEVLGRCRVLYNVAHEHRITAWQRCRVSVARYQQEAERKDLRAAFSEYAAIHSHVLQDVLARLDTKSIRPFSVASRMASGPAFHGSRDAPAGTRSPTRNTATEPRSTMGSSSFPSLGGLRSTGLALCRARPRPSRSRGRPTGGMCASPAPTCRSSRCRCP